MKLGFTGTRNGMTTAQYEAFLRLLILWQPAEFHFGDCVGADDEAAAAVAYHVPACRIIKHPPVDTTLQAHNPHFHEEREPKTHFARNRAIVNESDTLVGVVPTMQEEERGGTWYTIRYARKRGLLRYIIWPDGRIEAELFGQEQVPLGIAP